MWTTAGAAVDRGMLARARNEGYGVIDPQGGFQALEAALTGGVSQLDCVSGGLAPFPPQILTRRTVPAIFEQLCQTGPGGADRHRTTGRMQEAALEIPFLGSSTARQNTKQPSLRDRLAAVPPNQRRAHLTEQIRRETGRVLGLGNLESLPNQQTTRGAWNGLVDGR